MFPLGPLLHNTAALSSSAPIVGTTWDPANKGVDVILTNGNLTAEQNSGFDWVSATTSKSTGKWYFEVLVNNSTGGAPTHQGPALVDIATSVSTALPGNNGLFFCDLGIINGTGATAGTAPSTTIVDGTVIGVAVDADNKRVWFANNNTYGGDPVGATGYSTYVMAAAYPAVGELQGKCTGRFTAGSQSFSPPTGFTAWG